MSFAATTDMGRRTSPRMAGAFARAGQASVRRPMITLNDKAIPSQHAVEKIQGGYAAILAELADRRLPQNASQIVMGRSAGIIAPRAGLGGVVRRTKGSDVAGPTTGHVGRSFADQVMPILITPRGQRPTPEQQRVRDLQRARRQHERVLHTFWALNETDAFDANSMSRAQAVQLHGVSRHGHVSASAAWLTSSSRLRGGMGGPVTRYVVGSHEPRPAQQIALQKAGPAAPAPKF